MENALDTSDRHLIALLQANARESVALLGRKLGLARTTVVARIAKLEKSGVIGGYGLRMGAQIERGGVRAFCGLRVQPKTGAAVIRELAKLPEVEEVSAVSGQFDYLAFVHCTTHEQLDALLDHVGLIEGVIQTHTSIVLSRKIDRRSAVAV